MDFQKLLFDVGKALCKEEVKAIAFLCTDLLGRSLTSVELASDLFSRLIDQDHLSAERPQLLTELLLIIQRSRLIRDLQLPNPPTTSLISPYRKLLYNLSEGITAEDLKHVKFLLIKVLPRRKLEEAVSTLDIFLEMEHMDLMSDTNLTLLDDIVQSVCPMLKDKINQFKAQQVPCAGLVTQETGRTRSLSWPSQLNPAPPPSDPERPASCEMSGEFRPLTESTMNSSNISMDLPLQFHGTDASQDLLHKLSALDTETSRSSKVMVFPKRPSSPSDVSMHDPTSSMSPSSLSDVSMRRPASPPFYSLPELPSSLSDVSMRRPASPPFYSFPTCPSSPSDVLMCHPAYPQFYTLAMSPSSLSDVSMRRPASPPFDTFPIRPSSAPSQENKASEMQACLKPDLEVLETYPMTAATRGVCLIINNFNFSGSIQGLPNREGTMLDEDFLQKVFKWLDFEVEVHRDCSRQEMLSVFRELGSRNHSQMDCLVCCLLSHGTEGNVFGVDGLTVKIKELMESVNGLKCATLAEKPKLFFIQACQGTSVQEAVPIQPDSPAPSPVYSDAAHETFPCDADFLLGMATIPSFVSFREKKNGTWFIQSLCQNLVQMVPRGCDLVSILTKVNADVSQRSDSKGVKKQMPQPAFSLRKRVVFPIPQTPPPSHHQQQ